MGGKMKIAFDCSGTLIGNGIKNAYARILLRVLQDAGHEIIVWSNSFGYTKDAVTLYDLKNVETWPKMDKWKVDNDESQFVDYAIEDDVCQTWLAAKKFIWVKDLPETVEGIKALVKDMEG